MADKLTLPADWSFTTSWKRAVGEESKVNPLCDKEWMVTVGDGGYYRVTFVVKNQDLLAHCPCEGYHYRKWCAHVALLYHKWCAGKVGIQCLDSGEIMQIPDEKIRINRQG